MARKLIIRDKDSQEVFYPETLSNLVYDEITRNTVQEDLNKSENSESDLLELSTTDGAANKITLKEALTLGDVKLKKGHYPLDPGVTVNNVTFDLNGSCLQSTKEKVSTPLLYVKGNNSIIKNGELCGNYNTPVDDPNYEFYESESLIKALEYSNVLIENLDLHNCWGYSISYGGPTLETEFIRKGVYEKDVTAITYENEEDRETDTNEYLSKAIDIPSGFGYTCVYGGLGYYRIHSQLEVKYYFYDSSNNLIEVASDIPRMMVNIPEGATKVKFKTFRIGVFRECNIGFYKVKAECFTVKDCIFHNNHSLGMIGMAYGTTKVLNCISFEQGRPYSSAAAPTEQTKGLIDIEDIETPIFIMEGCTSKNEPKLAMLGAYIAIISNCHGSIGVYRGWSVNISNCSGNIWAFSNSVATVINVNNCVLYSNSTTSTNWVGTNNTFVGCKSDNLAREYNFIIRKINSYSSPSIVVNGGVINGKIINPYCRGGWLGITNVALPYGSHFTFEWNLASGKDSKTEGCCNVSGDCYGITATCPFLPNGHKIYDSVFNLTHSYGQWNSTNNAWIGEYNNCVFNLNGGSMFYNAAGSSNAFNLSKDNGVLIFRNCTINNENKYLFNGFPNNVLEKNYTIKFINCEIANQNKLFATSTAGITVEIITEDLDYDSRIKALEERIRQLEESN